MKKKKRNDLIALAESFLLADTPEEKNRLRRLITEKLNNPHIDLETFCEDLVYDARARNQGGLHW